MTQSPYVYNDNAFACAWGGPAGQASLKSNHIDFQVTELLNFTPVDAGEHLWLWIEKCGINTQWLAKQIARWAGVRPLDVGYAGLKDRHGVTQQWFSIYLPHKPELNSLDLEQNCTNEKESVRVLRQHWHQQKLRRGNNQGNRFIITLREVVADHAQLEQIISQIDQHGVPNYFGPQRFGREGDNVVQLLERGFQPPRRQKKGKKGGGEDILLSAGRSLLFNRLLSERIRDGSWNVPRDGDVMMLNGSQSIFLAESADETIRRRYQEHDIHITGPMWGKGELRSQGRTAEQEQSLADDLSELSSLLCEAGLKQERRSLRLLVENLQHQWEDETLCLSFDLPSGAYATAVLREMLQCQLPA